MARVQKLSDLPNIEKILEKNPELRKCIPKDELPPEPAKYQEKLEKELQRECENYLNLRGFKRLTPDNIEAGTDKGYYGHIVKAKRNPLFPDLVILCPPNHVLMVELKRSEKARFQPGQRELIEQGYAHLATTLEEFRDLLLDFEKEFCPISEPSAE